MTIRTFDSWISTNGRTATLPISILKGSGLGIDAEHYIQKRFGAPMKEPLVNALGGLPIGMKNTIEKDLEKLQEAGIKPVFVFHGCSVLRIEKPFSRADPSTSARVRAWEFYDKGSKSEAYDAFGELGVLNPADLYRKVMTILRDNDVEFLVAPYSAWPQLAYLQKEGFIDGIYGQTELVMFEVDKVITNIDLQAGQFQFIDKMRLCQDVQLSPDQFVDACLLAGSRLLRTFSPLETMPSASKSQFLEAVGLLKKYRSVGTALSSIPHAQPEYLKDFKKARAAVKHHVIVLDTGNVCQLAKERSPKDVHEFIGQRLPDELYFYMSRGVVGAQVPEMFTTGQFIESAPLDCNDSEEYKKFLNNVCNSMRAEYLSLLSKNLARYWVSREIELYPWYAPTNTKKLSHREIASPSERAQKWNVREEVFRPAMEAQAVQAGELAFCITSLEDEAFAAKTITPKNPAKLLETGDEIRINAIWRMLQTLGYVDGETHKLTPWGQALAAAVKTLAMEEDTLITSLFVAFSLYKANVLSGKDFVPNFSGNPKNGSEKGREYTRLISRVCSMVALEHKAGSSYDGPLNRSILAFGSFSRLMTKELRNYIEMTLANLLMSGDANREDRTDWTALGLKLPFIDDVNIAMGIAAHTYFEELNKQDDPTSEDAQTKSFDKLPETFPNAEDVVTDLQMTFFVFDAVVAGIKVLESAGIKKEEAKVFIEAADWLSNRR